MISKGDALAFMVLSAVPLKQYLAYDQLHLEIVHVAADLLDKAADAVLGNENIQAVYRQLQAAADVIDADAIEKALQNLKGLLILLIIAAIDGIKVIIATLSSYILQAVGYWQMQDLQMQAVVIIIIVALAILSLLKARLPSLFLGEDWSRYSSELEIREKCVEPLLKNLKIKYETERPCKFRQGDDTHEGKIDFFLYDDWGPITIIEDKITVKNEEDLRNARVQARSYCLGLYIFENIVVNSFMIASKEGLKIYRIKHNEDNLIEDVSPGKLKRSRKRWIKEKLLEIR